MVRAMMVALVLGLGMGAARAEAPAMAERPDASYARAVLDRLALRHPDLTALTLTAHSEKLKRDWTVSARLGQPMAKGQAERFDLPLRDVSGDVIGTLTIAFASQGMARPDLQVRAEAMAKALARQSSNAENLMQPDPFDRETPVGAYGQSLVDDTMARHDDILILVAHATAPGATRNVIIGSNIGRIGKPADEDDTRVFTTGKTNLEVNEKGNRFEVELVLHDRAGANIGALGVVYAYRQGADKAALEAKAVAVRDEMAGRIESAAQLFEPAAMRFAGRVDLPGYSGDFDHFAADAGSGRLFLAAEDHGTLEVFDLKSLAHRKTVKGVEVPHAILPWPPLNRLVVTDSGAKGSRAFDLATLKPVSPPPFARGADSAFLDAGRGRLYAVTGGADAKLPTATLEQLDLASGAIVARHEFDAPKVEAMAVEAQGPRLYINVTAKGEIAVLDKESLAPIAQWKVEEAMANAPMAFDEARRRLFIVTRKPGHLIVKDADSGTTIAHFPAPERADEVVYDAKRQRVYVLGGEGRIGVYRQVDAMTYREEAWIASAPGAKTGRLLPDGDRMVLAVSPGEGKLGAGILWFDLVKAP